MSAASNVAPLKAVKPNEVLIVGRVDGSRTHNKVRFTSILTPAPDPYSKPQRIEVRSKGQIGARGDDVSITCMVGGYLGRSFKSTDEDTGEIRTVQPVVHTFDLVE